MDSLLLKTVVILCVCKSYKCGCGPHNTTVRSQVGTLVLSSEKEKVTYVKILVE